MMNLRLIGAATFLLMLATPAMAMHQRYGQVIRSELPERAAPKYSYGSTYGAYNFSPRDDFATDHNIDDLDLDFDRRNTFN
ncbi:hypothetical protein [Bradyrhizobium sp.]|jgi:hypothetical protein|uniref:hypothetical protein n=1 Tax=Bradyrhizobium sp. TaxID=376 RepID=UPI003D0BAE7C